MYIHAYINDNYHGTLPEGRFDYRRAILLRLSAISDLHEKVLRYQCTVRYGTDKGHRLPQNLSGCLCRIRDTIRRISTHGTQNVLSSMQLMINYQYFRSEFRYLFNPDLGLVPDPGSLPDPARNLLPY
jgi:hypothetical protein